jgi:hypothetical protein
MGLTGRVKLGFLTLELWRDPDMAERKAMHTINIGKRSSLNLKEFAEYVESQAKNMELYGWREVHGLRKWVSELRKKQYQAKSFTE